MILKNASTSREHAHHLTEGSREPPGAAMGFEVSLPSFQAGSITEPPSTLGPDSQPGNASVCCWGVRMMAKHQNCQSGRPVLGNK